MRAAANALAMTIAIAALPASTLPAAACFQHTFERCSSPQKSKYAIALDQKTGRTWVKPQQVADAGSATDKAKASGNRLEKLAGTAAPAATTGSQPLPPWRTWRTQIIRE